MNFLCLLNPSTFPDYKRSSTSCQTNCINCHSNMLNKLFKVHKLTPFSRNVSPKPTAPVSAQPKLSSALKIVHAGGNVECYYMAIPAVKIMEKYPSFVVARPEVFRRPWDSVVRPDEILTLGGKFFLVPRRTVKKLRRKIRKPDREISGSPLVSKSSIGVSVHMVSCKRDDFSRKSFSQRSEVSDSSELSASKKKTAATKKHVRFACIEAMHKTNDSCIEAKISNVQDDDSKSLNLKSYGVKGRARNAAVAWEPSLKAVGERADE